MRIFAEHIRQTEVLVSSWIVLIWRMNVMIPTSWRQKVGQWHILVSGGIAAFCHMCESSSRKKSVPFFVHQTLKVCVFLYTLIRKADTVSSAHAMMFI